MGLNTKHNASRDTANGYNITRNIKFKYEPQNEKQTRQLEFAQGLEFKSLTRSIKLNRGSNIQLKDKIEIEGQQYLVITIDARNDNILEFKRSTYYNNFTGYMIVGLQ